MSFLGGLAEALVLGIIAKLAFAIAANDESIHFTISSAPVRFATVMYTPCASSVNSERRVAKSL